MSEISKIADHASQQSDRWLMIALMVLGIISVFYIGKYFVNKYENLVTEMHKLIHEGNETAKGLAVVLERNTEALKTSNKEIHDFMRLKEKIQAKL